MAPTERIEYRRVPDIPGVEVLLAEHCARRWHVFHETYSVCSLLDLSGRETEWTYRGKLHSGRAGGLMLIEPGELHANPPRVAVPPADFRALFLAPSLVERATAEAGMAARQPHLKFAYAAAPGLFRAFARFHATLEGVSSTLERETCLQTCVRLLFEQCTETGIPAFRQPDRSAVFRARDLIREHYSRAITLDNLVAATGLSRYHLVRAFERQLGLPPHAYQIHVQVEKARLILGKGVAPAEVAAEVGFADQSHFGRHFKRIYGVTPGQYRQVAWGR